MAVQTPQLDEPIYQPQQLQPPPMPSGQQAQPLPASAGFVPKAGAAAYVANSIVDGWLRGRQIKAQRNLQNAQMQLGSLYRNYQDQREQWKALAVQDPKSPAAQRAYQDATVAWDSYNSGRAKYVTPEEGEKKTKKQKVEGGFGQMFGKSGVTPQLFAQQAVQLSQGHPEGLYLTPDDQRNQAQTVAAQKEAELAGLQTEATKLALEQGKRNDANDVKMQAVVATPEADRTPEEKQWLDGWQRIQHIKDPQSQQFADSIMKKIQAGTPLSDAERNFAYAQRLLEGPQIAFRTDGAGKDQMVTYSQDGKILGQVNLGRHYEPDQVGPAMRLLRAQHDFYQQNFKQAGMSDREAEQAALLEQTKNPQVIAAFLGDSPMIREQQMSITDKALRSVMSEAGGPGASKDQKDAQLAKWSNFITLPRDNNATGLYAFRDQLAPGQTKGFFNKTTTYAGGMTPTDEAAEQAALYNRVRAKIQEQNPKLTSIEIDRIVPEWLKTPAAQQQMQAPPAAATPTEPLQMNPWAWAPAPIGPIAGAIQPFAAPPESQEAPKPGTDGIWGTKRAGSKLYQVNTEQGPQKVWMTPQDAQDAQEQGFSPSPIQ